MNNKVKIIAGQWRGRNIEFVDSVGLRPTPVRVRETLFNWLQYDMLNRRCLDLYAGSGALSFEALSRGAKSALQVEENPRVCRQLTATALKLGAQAQVNIVQREVMQFLATPQGAAFDVIFLDPPFNLNLAVPTCQCLEDNNWLAAQAKIYVEVEHDLILHGLPKNWQQLKHNVAGEVGYYLFQRETLN